LREPREVLATRLRRQAAWCAELDSPLYASLLDSAADDLDEGGPTADVLTGFEEERGTTALALRLMAAVHTLVLDETLPDLAAHYPSTGGDGDASAAWPLFERALVDHQQRIRVLLGSGCQTNEVGRSAALLGGFLEVAHRTRMPLRILELGASAGLNLRWDRYRYESPRGAWGDTGSRVRFTHAFEIPPPLGREAVVVERKGCDVSPIDSASDEGALTLRAFVWADQLGRLAQLDGAIDIAADFPVDVEPIDAADFVERELAKRPDGVATIVYHSVFIQYVEDEGRRRILAAIEEARRRARRGAPVFHLRMEPGETTFEVRLDDELLATTRPHGTAVRWLKS
jgi:hypothetical protein